VFALVAGDAVDAAVLAALGLFLVWGSMHGLLRQGLGLVAVALGFVLASAFSGALAPSVAKVVDLDPDERVAVAWVVVWSLTVVVGGVLLHGARHVLDRRPPPRPVSRAVGAAVGLAKGILVLGVFFYVVLGAYARGPAAPPVLALRESRAASGAMALERALRPVLGLPDAVASLVARANATVRRGGGAS
jgi:hypothetical protein